MKKTILALFCAACQFVFAQSHSRLKVCPENNTILQDLGICTDHVITDKNCIISDFSSYEKKKLKEHHVFFEVLIEDVTSHYQKRNLKPSLKATAQNQTCNSTDSIEDVLSKYEDPSGFTLGSMGGFFTYEEFLDHMDTLSTRYPNLISSKMMIDTFHSHQGHPIYYWVISDHPNQQEATEPKVLYTSIHHAREPAGLSQLIYFMYYLAENYDSDLNISTLLDTTQLYVVPMVNPDGYIYNQTTSPNGGGLWRKNRRDNGDGTYGVDLNRNYGYQWGGSGSSADTESDIYRGPNAFSEPETQALKYLCESHDFTFALNYHTFSNLLLFPFGYDVNQFSDDHNYFECFTQPMVEENNYVNQMASELYPAAGDSDDWMYADTTQKNKVFALTPEVGSSQDGFWPAASRIPTLCKENIKANMSLIKLPHSYIDIMAAKDSLITQNQLQIILEYKQLGLLSGSAQINYAINSPLSSFSNQSTSTPTLSNMETFNDTLLLDIDTQQFTLNIDTILLELSISNALFNDQKNIPIILDIIPDQQINLYDSVMSSSLWDSQDWSITAEEFVSPLYSFTDSESGNYTNNQTSIIEFGPSIDLSDATYANVYFWAKWEIEKDYDYVQFDVFSDNQWIPQCGLHTTLGTPDQDYQKPLYDGVSDWVLERISLDDYVGESDLKFRFVLHTDQFVTEDGFYFDDFILQSNSSYSLVSSAFHKANYDQLQVYPNPSDGSVFFLWDTKQYSTSTLSFKLHNILGQNIWQKEVENTGQLDVDFTFLSKGTYTIQVLNNNTQETQRLIIK